LVLPAFCISSKKATEDPGCSRVFTTMSGAMVRCWPMSRVDSDQATIQPVPCVHAKIAERAQRCAYAATLCVLEQCRRRSRTGHAYIDRHVGPPFRSSPTRRATTSFSLQGFWSDLIKS
jgi:hypothetical protein